MGEELKQALINEVAKAIFLSQHPDAEWSAGRARICWFDMAEAAMKADPHLSIMREALEAIEKTTFVGVTSLNEAILRLAMESAHDIANSALEELKEG